MDFSLLRRHTLLSFAALALGGCASSGDGAADNAAVDGQAPSLASLPVKVLMTQGFAEVHRSLEPQLVVPTHAYVDSGNGTVPAVATALAARLQADAAADVLVAPRAVMEQLQSQGVVRRGSLVDVLRTPLAVAVQAGRPVPPIDTADALRAALRKARSVAYPSADGSAFVEQKMLPTLGIQNEVMLKSIKVFGPQVGALVARGDAELGLQSLSELLLTPGITIAGLLPEPLAYATVYTAGIAERTHSNAGAHALLRFYQQETAAHDWHGSGWEAVARKDGSRSD